MKRDRFRSAADPIVRLLPLCPGLAALWSVFKPNPDWFLASVMALVLFFLIWLIVGTDYLLDGADLLIRSGPFRWRVPANSIERVRPTRTWMAGPALSFDRLELRGRFGRVLVSPRDRHAFLAALHSVAPDARFEHL